MECNSIFPKTEASFVELNSFRTIRLLRLECKSEDNLFLSHLPSRPIFYDVSKLDTR